MAKINQHLDEEDFVIPSRTVLYNITPLATNCGLREGLISYLVRLARAHSVRPRELIRLVLAEGHEEIGRLCYNSFYVEYANTINGLGKYARLFSERLNSLTGRQDLDELTMLPWADLIPDQSEGFIARHRHWCPHCIADQLAERGEPFDPLVWSLDQYRNCTIHGMPLKSHCPHCGLQQDFIPSLPTLDQCCKCGGSLAEIGSKGCADLSCEALVESLISAPHKAKQRDLQVQFQDELRRVVNEQYAGNRAALCRALNWNPWALKGWLDRDQRVSFPKLIELIASYGLQIPGLGWPKSPKLADNVATGKLNRRSMRPMLSQAKRSILQSALQQELLAEVPRCISALANNAGLTRSALRYWFPDECQAIVDLRKGIRGRSALQAKQSRHTALLRAVTDLRRQGLPLTRRAVDREIRAARLSLANPEVRDAFANLKNSLS